MVKGIKKNENEKEFLNENMCISNMFLIFCSTDHWHIWCYHRYASMLIKVKFCSCIRLEDTSSVEVNNNVRICLKKTKEMKTIIIDLINSEREIKTYEDCILKKRERNENDNDCFKKRKQIDTKMIDVNTNKNENEKECLNASNWKYGCDPNLTQPMV